MFDLLHKIIYFHRELISGKNRDFPNFRAGVPLDIRESKGKQNEKKPG
jgi:hypothetical protein